MMTYYVETLEMGGSILSDEVGKPFSVRPAADDDLLCRNAWVYPFLVMRWVSHSQCVLQLMMTYHVETTEMGVSILSDGVGKPFSVRPSAEDKLLQVVYGKDNKF